jgi:hypothetical protein
VEKSLDGAHFVGYLPAVMRLSLRIRNRVGDYVAVPKIHRLHRFLHRHAVILGFLLAVVAVLEVMLVVSSKEMPQ